MIESHAIEPKLRLFASRKRFRVLMLLMSASGSEPRAPTPTRMSLMRASMKAVTISLLMVLRVRARSSAPAAASPRIGNSLQPSDAVGKRCCSASRIPRQLISPHVRSPCLAASSSRIATPSVDQPPCKHDQRMSSSHSSGATPVISTLYRDPGIS